MELQKVQDKRKGGKKMALITIIMLKSVRAVIIKLRLSCLLKTNDSTTKYNRQNRFIFISDGTNS
jgi:hypothetical protein